MIQAIVPFYEGFLDVGPIVVALHGVTLIAYGTLYYSQLATYLAFDSRC